MHVRLTAHFFGVYPFFLVSPSNCHAARNTDHPNQLRPLFFPWCVCVLLIFSTEEDGDIVSVTLPPSNHTRTVVITRSRPFSDHVSILENQPIGPPTLIYLSRLSAPPSDVNVSTTDDITVPNDKPLALSFETATRPEVVRAGGNSTPTAPRPPAIESDVTTISASMDMLALEGRVSPREAVNPVSQTASPPSHLRECSPGERFHVSEAVRFKYPPLAVGWKGGRCWVVVIRGRDVGVFHDFWYVSSLVSWSSNLNFV